MATSSMEGSRRANCPMPRPSARQRREIATLRANACGDCNDVYLDQRAIINWRASLVPAAAVIPAPIAYIKVVAVKKLVVGFRVRGCGKLVVTIQGKSLAWKQLVKLSRRPLALQQG